MKLKKTKYIPTLLILSTLTFSVYANDTPPTLPMQTGPSVTTLLKNLGTYLGYDISNASQNQISSMFIDTTQTVLFGNGNPALLTLSFNSLLGAMSIPASTSQTNSDNAASLVPKDIPEMSQLNSLVNKTFASYKSPSSESPTVSVSPVIDQQPYQSDPVNQSVLNMISTPNYTYCLMAGTDPSVLFTNTNCPWLTGQHITNNVMGITTWDDHLKHSIIPISPSLQTQAQAQRGAGNAPFFSDEYYKDISQLNSNSLIEPLMYSTTSNSGSSTGLPAQNQLQEAANYIQYAAGSIVPLALPKQDEYIQYYNIASGLGRHTQLEQEQAQALLATYFAKLRVYAAQTSVAYGNLYYILSKRIPQQVDKDSPKTSQALAEFKMATWRLFNPSGEANKTWSSQINSASTASVNKEMVTLLAEINYQLYLTRQQQERLLLTNTILLLESGRASQPMSPATMALTPQ